MPEDEQGTLNPFRMLTAISRVPVLVVLIFLYLVFVLYVFPNSAYEGEVGPLDLKFSYSPATAYDMIESYGEEGRARYARSAMTIDFAYPIVYTLLFMVWITLAVKGANMSDARRCFIAMVPLSVFILDLTENTGIIILLKTYPAHHETLAMATSFATSAKWSAAGLVIVMTLLATAHWAWRRLTS